MGERVGRQEGRHGVVRTHARRKAGGQAGRHVVAYPQLFDEDVREGVLQDKHGGLQERRVGQRQIARLATHKDTHSTSRCTTQIIPKSITCVVCEASEVIAAC